MRCLIFPYLIFETKHYEIAEKHSFKSSGQAHQVGGNFEDFFLRTSSSLNTWRQMLHNPIGCEAPASLITCHFASGDNALQKMLYCTAGIY